VLHYSHISEIEEEVIL